MRFLIFVIDKFQFFDIRKIIIDCYTQAYQSKMKRQRQKTYLIQQDQHLENIRKIIKRDFFSTLHQKQENIDETIPLGLNDYLKNFKSNQNQIFTELVQANAEQWKKKHQWMEKSKQLMLESGKSDKPFTNMIKKDPTMKAIDFSIVKQDPKNAVFFSPSRQTKSKNDAQHDRVKKVYHYNCRIQQQQLERSKKYQYKFVKDPNLQQIPSTPILEGRHRKREPKVGFNKNQSQDYSMKRAPSPEPQKIPIMTWGQIQSTPMRISDVPQYKIQDISKRDKLLDQLTSKIIKEKLSKNNRKDEMKLKILSSVRVGGSSYRKPSVARQSSQVRKVVYEGNNIGEKLDELLNPRKK